MWCGLMQVRASRLSDIRFWPGRTLDGQGLVGRFLGVEKVGPDPTRAYALQPARAFGVRWACCKPDYTLACKLGLRGRQPRGLLL